MSTAHHTRKPTHHYFRNALCQVRSSRLPKRFFEAVLSESVSRGFEFEDDENAEKSLDEKGAIRFRAQNIYRKYLERANDERGMRYPTPFVEVESVDEAMLLSDRSWVSSADPFDQPFLKPLCGAAVFAVSDAIDVAGYTSRYGLESGLALHRNAKRDHPFVAFLRTKGARFCGKLQCHDPLAFQEGLITRRRHCFGAQAVANGYCNFALLDSCINAAAVSNVIFGNVVAFKPTTDILYSKQQQFITAALNAPPRRRSAGGVESAVPAFSAASRSAAAVGGGESYVGGATRGAPLAASSSSGSVVRRPQTANNAAAAAATMMNFAAAAAAAGAAHYPQAGMASFSAFPSSLSGDSSAVPQMGLFFSSPSSSHQEESTATTNSNDVAAGLTASAPPQASDLVAIGGTPAAYSLGIVACDLYDLQILWTLVNDVEVPVLLDEDDSSIQNVADSSGSSSSSSANDDEATRLFGETTGSTGGVTTAAMSFGSEYSTKRLATAHEVARRRTEASKTKTARPISVGIPVRWINDAEAVADLRTFLEKRGALVKLIHLSWDTDAVIELARFLASYEFSVSPIGAARISHLPDTLVSANIFAADRTNNNANSNASSNASSNSDVYQQALFDVESMRHEIAEAFFDVDLVAMPLFADPYRSMAQRTTRMYLPFALAGSPLVSVPNDDATSSLAYLDLPEQMGDEEDEEEGELEQPDSTPVPSTSRKDTNKKKKTATTKKMAPDERRKFRLSRGGIVFAGEMGRDRALIQDCATLVHQSQGSKAFVSIHML